MVYAFLLMMGIYAATPTWHHCPKIIKMINGKLVAGEYYDPHFLHLVPYTWEGRKQKKNICLIQHPQR